MERIRIGDACEILNGYAFKSDKYVADGIRVIRIANVQKGYIEDSTPAFYPLDSAGLEKYMLEEGDLLMSLTGNVGRVAMLEKQFLPAALNQRVACLRLKTDRISKGYLFHILNSDYFEQQCIQSSKGVAQKNMSTEWLKDYEIPLYSKEEQAIIERILDKVRAITSARQQEFRTLDGLIKARFVEMFGDLFKNNKGWKEMPLGKTCDKVVRYPTFYGMDYLEQGTRVIRIGNILPDGHMDLVDANYVFVYENVNDDFPETVIEKNDIVMAVRGDGSAAKRIGIVTEEELIGANISPNLIRIKANPDILNPVYLFFYLTGEIGQMRLDSYVNKTAKKNIAAKDIVKVIVPVPHLELQNEYAKFVAQVNKSKVVVKQAHDKAQLLFDSLMQKYFG